MSLPSPVFDNASTASVSVLTGSDSITWSHTIFSDQNTILLIQATSLSVATSITYGSQTGSLLIRIGGGGIGNLSGQHDYANEIWYVLNPTQGTNNIRINLLQGTPNIVAGAVSYYNVVQRSPTPGTEANGLPGISSSPITSTTPIMSFPAGTLTTIFSSVQVTGSAPILLSESLGSVRRYTKTQGGNGAFGTGSNPWADQAGYGIDVSEALQPIANNTNIYGSVWATSDLNSDIWVDNIVILNPAPIPAPATDFIIGAMNLLKSAWQLTGSLAANNIAFMTGYYQEQLRMPAIVITPLVEPMRLLHFGPHPQYKINHIIQCHIWVQPPTSSNTALGQAKNTRYQLQQEVERIIRSGSTLIPGTQFVKISESFGREIMNVNPPILGWEMRINTVDFRLYPTLTPIIVPPVIISAVFNPAVFNPPVFVTVGS